MEGRCDSHLSNSAFQLARSMPSSDSSMRLLLAMPKTRTSMSRLLFSSYTANGPLSDPLPQNNGCEGQEWGTDRRNWLGFPREWIKLCGHRSSIGNKRSPDHT